MSKSVPESIPGVRVLLMGESGSGKTYSLRTLFEDDEITDVFVLYTEPGMEVLADLPHDNPNGPNYHWAYVKPTTVGTKTLLEKAQRMNAMTWEGMQKQTDDPKKKEYDAGVRFLKALNQPTCAECGAQFDDVTTWGNDKVIVVDSLSGVNQAAMQLVAGGSIAKSQPQWGAAMNTEMDFINQLCYDTYAHFVMTAHVEKDVDEINGGQVITINALGRKNAPEIPKNFSDVIYCYHEGPKFYWSTASASVVTKTRNLQMAPDLKPTFEPIIANWRAAYSKKSEAEAKQAVE